ncbi:MAG TPA: hypothetical protein VMZ92_16025 [Planctomycetota bacterium]|nr:hypothetical protein [Planctomycetota bacterium]
MAKKKKRGLRHRRLTLGGKVPCGEYIGEEDEEDKAVKRPPRDKMMRGSTKAK